MRLKVSDQANTPNILNKLQTAPSKQSVYLFFLFFFNPNSEFARQQKWGRWEGGYRDSSLGDDSGDGLVVTPTQETKGVFTGKSLPHQALQSLGCEDEMFIRRRQTAAPLGQQLSVSLTGLYYY